ncbi:MAG: H-NS histone family protein [Aromatoleum sp.]|jgi:DNA-binding protein H-NS|uniref:H-NS histone family protein n=1 Tax=Aromatoleum sp. TaxID=2307007 RepID=UPI00289594BD|nr:H-NS histone family protein [Aromatoleum sp.]MDT3670727.1 H-NS histone family protein [Aromatoleum sp.]
MELAKLSLTELRRLQSRVETEIRRRSDSARRDLLKKVQKMAAEEGLSLSDLLGSASSTGEEKQPSAAKRKTKPAAKKNGTLPAKYRHPENPAVGWSGRGRKPQWVIDWLAQDKPLAELEASAGK